MADNSDDDGFCSNCDLPDVHVRLVMTTWADEPVPLCDRCYRALDEEGKIDHEADAEYFGYA